MPERLVADHERAGIHHLGLQLGGHLFSVESASSLLVRLAYGAALVVVSAAPTHPAQLLLPLGRPGLTSEPARDVPEANVGALWFRPQQQELVALLLDPLHLVAVGRSRSVGGGCVSSSSPRSLPRRYRRGAAYSAATRAHSPGHVEQVLHVFRVAGSALGAPHEPELEDVVVAAALDHFVARVEADVVLLVLLEQVVGAHLVAAH